MIFYPKLLININVISKIVSPREIYFWKNIIERLSLKDAPFNTEIKDDYLYPINYSSTKWKKGNVISLTESNISDIIDFFKNCIGINLVFLNYYSWKDIKKKSIKDDLIQIFVLNKQKEYNLTMNEQKILLSFIQLNITLKFITHEHIILKVDNNTYISSITNLLISKNFKDSVMNVKILKVIKT
jgi:hypothetical protein